MLLLFSLLLPVRWRMGSTERKNLSTRISACCSFGARSNPIRHETESLLLPDCLNGENSAFLQTMHADNPNSYPVRASWIPLFNAQFADKKCQSMRKKRRRSLSVHLCRFEIFGKVTAAKRVSVPLAGVNRPQLVVTDAGDGITSDHADWAEAVLIGKLTNKPVSSVPPPRPARFKTGSPGLEIELSDLPLPRSQGGPGTEHHPACGAVGALKLERNCGYGSIVTR